MLTDLGGDEGCKQCSETNRRYIEPQKQAKFTTHGRNSGSQCSHCDREGYQRMAALRDFHRFQKLDSWPANLVEYSQRHAYDLCVAKWTARFAEVLASGRVTPEEHAAVMSKLAPWTGPLAQ